MHRINKIDQNNKGSKDSKGFTLLELMIAVTVGAIIIAGGITLAVATTKQGKFVEKFADTSILLSQKTNELFNNAANEVKKIPTGQLQIGSINPEQPLTGYFDVLNQSGCLIKSNSFPAPTKGFSSQMSSQRGKLGDIGGDSDGGDGGNGTLNQLDCSSSVISSPSDSVEAKFRRQWLIRKDFPTPGDITFSVTIVAIQTNEIILCSTITKSDGISVK